MTFWSCYKSLEYAWFHVLFSSAGHRTSSAFHFTRFSIVLVIRSFVFRPSGGVGHATGYFCFLSFHRFMPALVRCLIRWVVMSRTLCLFVFNTRADVYVSFSSFSTLLFKIVSNQLIRFGISASL